MQSCPILAWCMSITPRRDSRHLIAVNFVVDNNIVLHRTDGIRVHSDARAVVVGTYIVGYHIVLCCFLNKNTFFPIV